MRLIKSLQSATNNQLIRIYHDSACNEYIVRVVGQPLCDYFTDDKEDALATAKLMASTRPKMAKPIEALQAAFRIVSATIRAYDEAGGESFSSWSNYPAYVRAALEERQKLGDEIRALKCNLGQSLATTI